MNQILQQIIFLLTSTSNVYFRADAYIRYSYYKLDGGNIRNDKFSLYFESLIYIVKKIRFVLLADVMATITQLPYNREIHCNSNLLYYFRFMTNLTNSYVFPSYISFHDKLDTVLTHSLKDEEMMLRN